jgi:hypothetical protein
MLMWNIWGRREIAYSILVGKPEGKTRGRQEDTIEMRLKRSRKISHRLN